MEDKLRACSSSGATKCLFKLFEMPGMTLSAVRDAYRHGVQAYLRDAKDNNVLDGASRQDFEDAMRLLIPQTRPTRYCQATQIECLSTIFSREEDREILASIWRREISEMGIRTVHPDAEPSAPSGSLPPVNTAATLQQNMGFFIETYTRLNGPVRAVKLVRQARHPWDGTVNAGLEDEVGTTIYMIAHEEGDDETLARFHAGRRVKFVLEDDAEEESESESEDEDDEDDDNGDVVMADAGPAPQPANNLPVGPGPVAAPAALPVVPAIVGVPVVPVLPVVPAPLAAAPAPAPPALNLLPLPPPPPPNSNAARAAAENRIDGVSIWFCPQCTNTNTTQGVIRSRRSMLTRHFRESHNMSIVQARQRMGQLYP